MSAVTEKKTLVVRPAWPGDGLRVASLVDRNREDLNVTQAEVPARAVEFMRERRNMLLLFADVNDVLPAGMVILHASAKESSKHCASLRLVVDREHWSEGYGTILMEAAILLARQLGIRRIEATPYLPLSPWKYHLFIDKGGFEIEGVLKDRFRRGGHRIDALMLARHVDPLPSWTKE